MSKRFLTNFFKRRVKGRMSFLENERSSFGRWGSEQIKKVGNLGQEIVIMQMG